MRVTDVPLFLVTDQELSCTLAWTDKSMKRGALPVQQSFLSSGGIIVAVPAEDGHTLELEDMFFVNNSGSAAAVALHFGSGGPLIFQVSLPNKKQLSFVDGFGWSVQT